MIPATADVDYYFRSYAAAKGKLRSADYQRSYAGMYAKGNSLEDLWAKHNRDSRPFAHRMRSKMCIRDRASRSPVLISNCGRDSDRSRWWGPSLPTAMKGRFSCAEGARCV